MKPIQSIPLQQIDVADESFSVNFMPDLRGLRASIREAGLIQPVILRREKDGYQVICGFRRISVLKELEYKEVESRVFEEKEKSESEFFLISLHDNLTSRGFNPVEKAIALDKLIHRFQVGLPSAIQDYLPLFSLEPNEKILSTYLSLARMEEKVKAYVLNEEVSRSNIRTLATMSSEDRMALYPFLSGLKLGENRLREMLTLVIEDSRRERVTLRELIDRPEIQTILANKELTPVQRTERARRVLMNLRYPRMERMEEEFEKRRKTLDLPSGVSLLHSPYFEGKDLKIEFQFRTIDEYRSIVSSLSSLGNKKEFEEMVQESQIRSTKSEFRNNLK
jgi:ParB family chromosome partitioning protein